MIEQSPILREADEYKNAYRGFAMAQMRILKDYMQLARLNTYSRVVTLANGVVITCKKSFNREDVFVYVPSGGEVLFTEEVVSITGIIFHPRSGGIEDLPYTEYVVDELGSHAETMHLAGVKGGWSNGKDVLNTPYIYPLVDSDNASFLKGSLTTKKYSNGSLVSGMTEDKDDFIHPGVYGNLYWDNGAVYDAENKKWDKPYVVLSWRGTPTRHFRLPSNIDIPGFSLFETATPGTYEDTPEYTAFGTQLYQGGGLSATAPNWSWPYNGSGVGNKCLILGAMQGDAGLFIVTQNDHYNAPNNVWIYSNGERREGDTETYLATVSGVQPPVTIVFTQALTKPGFFLGLWKSGGKVGGWELVAELSYSRKGLPWFGNVSGTEFVCSNGDKLTISGTLTPRQNSFGGYEETGEQCLTTFHSTYNGQDYFEFGSDTLLNAVITHSFTAATSFSDTANTYNDMGKNWPEVVHPDDPVINMRVEPGTDVSYIMVYGGMSPKTSNVGTFTDTNRLDFTGQCGTKQVTITDACGLVFDAGLRRMPLGYWDTGVPTCVPRACGGIWTCSSKYLKTDCTAYDSIGAYAADNSYTGPVVLNTGDNACPTNPCGYTYWHYIGNQYQKVWKCP
jgi:hypothetical protein